MAADPQIDYTSGTITLEFEESTNYTISKCKVGPCLDNDSSVFLEIQDGNIETYEDFEDPFFLLWRFSSGLSLTDANGFVDEYAGIENMTSTYPTQKAGMAAIPSSPSTGTRFFSGWFYDPVSFGTEEMAFALRSGNLASPVSYGDWSFGVDDDFLGIPFKYLHRRNSDAVWVDTGLFRSTAWHHVFMRTSHQVQAFPPFDHIRTWNMYIDGVLYVNISETAGVATNDWTSMELQKFSDSQQWGMEEWAFGRGGVDIYEEGTAQIDIQPSLVKEFTSYSVNEDYGASAPYLNGWKGTNTHEVSFSTDGGTNFGTNAPTYDDTNFTTLTNENLQSFLCDGDGQDVLRYRATLTPDATIANNSHSPRINTVTFNFAGYRYPFEYFE